uniref:Uncharacterized protein n=1 Tax=Arundo donax TaxID=35708 RepID=A0A0A8ZKD8_ARUDO
MDQCGGVWMNGRIGIRKREVLQSGGFGRRKSDFSAIPLFGYIGFEFEI